MRLSTNVLSSMFAIAACEPVQCNHCLLELRQAVDSAAKLAPATAFAWPAATPSLLGTLELRQAKAPDPAPPPVLAPANPAGLPANPPVPVTPVVPPVDDAAVPIITTSPTTWTATAPPAVTADFTTVQWVETWIGGTYSTWVPHTILFHFPDRIPGPAPGKGEIGMGTLTGETGQTKTQNAGAAVTPGRQWMKGMAVAVGAGLAGMVV